MLVHYLASKKLGRANSDPRCQSEPMLPHFWDTARTDDYERLPCSNKAQRTYQGGLQDTCMNFEQVQSQGCPVLAARCPVLTACYAPCTRTLCTEVQAKCLRTDIATPHLAWGHSINRNSLLERLSCRADGRQMLSGVLSSRLHAW